MDVAQFLADLGHRIREERAKRALTGAELALKAGLNPRFLQEVERGETELSMLQLIRLARALQMHPAALLESP